MPAIPPVVYAFMSGAICALAFVAAVLFARFYRRTGDRLFVYFAVAFAMLAVNNVIIVFAVDRFSDAPEDSRHPIVYCVRLLAFALILFAIVDKNRARRGSK